jgi:hypothetical protein
MKSRYESEDLRVRQNEFCDLWGCEKRDGNAACTYCPFIRDALEMADEMAMEIPAWNYDIITRRN